MLQLDFAQPQLSDHFFNAGPRRGGTISKSCRQQGNTIPKINSKVLSVSVMRRQDTCVIPGLVVRAFRI